MSLFGIGPKLVTEIKAKIFLSGPAEINLAG
jgi:hypothetical protein